MNKFLKIAFFACSITVGSLAHGVLNPARAQPQPNNGAANACTSGHNVSVPMHIIASHAGHDPSAVWSDWNLWNPFAPRQATVWEGQVQTCHGTVIVSQMITRECEGPDTCPVRVVLNDGKEIRRLLDYEQVCTLHDTFTLSGDGRALIACDREFSLDVQ